MPKNIADLLEPLAMAVWIMDDGCLNRNVIDISTYSFKLGEIKLLQKAIYKNFALETNFFRDRDKGFSL